MTGSAKWHEENTKHLAAAVAAIRTRLQHYARPESASVITPEPAPQEEARSVWRLFSRKQIAPSSPQAALPPAGASSAGAAPPSTAISTAVREAPPALTVLTERLNLSPFERDILVLCAAMELDTSMAALCAHAQDSARPYPTFALALTVLENPAWEALSPDRPLRYWRLIEINQPGGQPLTTSALRADERIVNYLKGLNYLDDRLAPLVWPLDADQPLDAGTREEATAAAIATRLKQSPPDRKLPIVQLIGRDTPTKAMLAVAAAAQLGLRVYRMHMSMLPLQPSDLEAFARLWHRESLLLPAGLYLEGEPGEGDASRIQTVQTMLSRLNAVVFLDTQDVWPGLAAPNLLVEVHKPSASEQQAAWTASIGDAAGESPSLLAGQFDLGLPSIHEIARQARASESPDLHQRLWTGALAATRPRMDALAQRIDAKATWDDIVLPDAELQLLRQIAGQVAKRTTVYDEWGFRERSSRGLGITALFSGPSGTGKTMAAEVVANDLKLGLHRIDLSTVVSKYIGETEKNLRRLFDAAEDGGTVLFFDEADALFGKRSEVKDSHDRYANIEINYLLQRMEAYRGLAILATNMKSALDDAFVRRLRFIVNFPFPAATDRKLIWQKVFPSRVPVADLDFDRLARLNVTGGNVYNIAMNAAFLAARAGTPVSMPLVLEAARAEFRKMERPINEADFRWKGVA